LLVTVVGVAIARSAQEYDTAQNITLIGGLLIFARLFWQFLEWLSRVYVLTDQRVVTLGGVLRVRVFEAPLNNLTHNELLFSLRERFFALGTLAFYTAGSGLAEAYWVMVARPLEVHAKVVETLKRYRR
ncbi:MAG: PH domain-containing protein, partial [Planctomycetota bacterium]